MGVIDEHGGLYGLSLTSEPVYMRSSVNFFQEWNIFGDGKIDQSFCLGHVDSFDII